MSLTCNHRMTSKGSRHTNRSKPDVILIENRADETNEEKQMDGARLSVTDHKQREKEGDRGRNEKV